LHRNSVFNAERLGLIPRDSYAGKKIAEALDPLGVKFETRADEFVVILRPNASAR
jgi:hypothetical protein